MSRAPCYEIESHRLKLAGYSVAGIESWCHVAPPGIAFDVGRGNERLVSCEHLFVTHPHSDHAAGIIWIAAQRKLFGLDPPAVYVPDELSDRYRRVLEAYRGLYGSEPHMTIEGVREGSSITLGRYAVTARAVAHTVPSLGWELSENRRTLLDEWNGASPETIRAAVSRGETVAAEASRSLLFYSGDTTAAVFEASPSIFESETVILECTYTGPDEKNRAEKYGHLHLDDLVPWASRFRCERLILTHFSARSSWEVIRDRIVQALPGELLARTFLVFGSEAVDPLDGDPPSSD